MVTLSPKLLMGLSDKDFTEKLWEKNGVQWDVDCRDSPYDCFSVTVIYDNKNSA